MAQPLARVPARWRRALAWALAALALALVFASYLAPGMVVTLANQIWACF